MRIRVGISLTLLIAVLVTAILQSAPQIDRGVKTAVARVTPSTPVSKVPPAPGLLPRVQTRTIPPSRAALATLKHLIGDDVRLEFLPNGALSSIEGGSRRGLGRFSTAREDAIQARAIEILAAAKPLLRLDADTILDGPAIQIGDSAAQAFFRQTRNGVPVVPGGSITVVLGQQGELVGLYSSSVSALRIENERKLTAEQARLHASTVIGRADGGRAVLWTSVTGGSRHAYEFFSSGKQIVVDADTGSIISRRDRAIRN